MMDTEKEYMKIGKAVIEECMAHGDERCITVTLRAVQYDGKLYIRMEDVVDPISIWDYRDLMAISGVNRNQRARERARNQNKRVKLPAGSPRVVIAE